MMKLVIGTVLVVSLSGYAQAQFRGPIPTAPRTTTITPMPRTITPGPTIRGGGGPPPITGNRPSTRPLIACSDERKRQGNC